MLRKSHRLIHVKSPAKVNLFLAVKGRRIDGYHEIISLMCRVRLFDELTIRFGFEDHAVFCSSPNVPENGTNLAYRAAVVFFENLPDSQKHDLMGVHISIAKKIPVGAGLGGGSSNAASVLMGLNRFYGNIFSKSFRHADI